MRRSLFVALVGWVVCAVVPGCNEGGRAREGTAGKKPLEPASKNAAAAGISTEATRLAAVGKKPDIPAVPAEKAPAASPRRAAPDKPEKLAELVGKLQTSFDRNARRRLYVQVDKPLYKPGEVIWVKTWDLAARTLDGVASRPGLTYELVSPKGAVVITKRVQMQAGMATNDFEIPEGVQGGEYQIRARRDDGTQEERPVIVSTYEPPRIKMKLEFVRKAYGAGDEVTATIEARRATGDGLTNHPLQGLIRLDGQDLPRVKLTTNQLGDGLVKFTLPKDIAQGDGILTVLAEDGGVTESVSRRIPIIVKKLQLAMFPEGGELVFGLPSRVYLEAKNPLGKPADVEGRIVDDVGNTAVRFATVRDGLGRAELTPASGRRYEVVIDKPVGVTERYALPAPAEKGCVLRSFDDLDGELEALRVAVRCTEKRTVHVVGMLRDNLLDTATVDVDGSAPAIVHLQAKEPRLARAQGVARLTVLDAELAPLAERVVYRNRRARLGVKVEAHKKSYAPRDQVTLAITTRDASGNATPAELALSVVDDTVVSFADDKTGHMLSRLYLEAEVPGKIEEPNFYFDLSEPKSAMAMDLLMGTRGYRKFEWGPVLSPPPPKGSLAEAFGRLAGDQVKGVIRLGRLGAGGGLGLRGLGEGGAGFGMGNVGKRAERGRAMDRAMPGGPRPVAAIRPAAAVATRAAVRAAPAMPAAAPAPAAPAAAMPAAEAEIARPAAEKPARRPGRQEMAADDEEAPAGKRLRDLADDPAPARPAAKEWKVDKDWAGERAKKKVAHVGWAPVRVFPAPTYGGADPSGPRTDFRETIHWQPSVKTGKDGTATVTFYLSDAVGSFRVFSEGVGAGAAGRDETVVKSNLPFSLAAKLPVEVSAGDRILLPVTLTNERDGSLDVKLETSFGTLLSLERPVERLAGTMPAGARQSLFYPLQVTGAKGKSEVRLSAQASGLKDEVVRELEVVPLGFPQVFQKSGELRGQAKAGHDVDLGQAIPGSARITVTLYPSPVATMVSGLDGLLREPSGCFEQASSSNYPNVMVLQYMKQNNVSDPQILARTSRLLDQGYKRLVGYESKGNGYEWFGGVPAHEALTAYGLVEFVDMRQVYGDVDNGMVERTSRWLKSRRDGKGGYKLDAKALDSFGRASPEVTNAYVTYSLSEARELDNGDELALSAKLAQTSQDAYLLALAANTLLNVPARKAEGVAAARRLAGLQSDDGAWSKASHSITRSGGNNLTIETTALSILALIKAGGFAAEFRRGVEWLSKNRGGFGQWGATQATVLALKAMTAYARASARTPTPGSVTVLVNGQAIERVDYAAGRHAPIKVSAEGTLFTAGSNHIEIQHSGRAELPYSVALEYRSTLPATSPKAPIHLETRLERGELRMGETVRLQAVITNKTAQGQPMTLARIGIPGGLAFQTWQLKELKDKGMIAFYETRAREVILYFREMAPNASVTVPVELQATVPGEYTAPASSAYLYYNDEHKTWVEPVKVQIGT